MKSEKKYEKQKEAMLENRGKFVEVFLGTPSFELGRIGIIIDTNSVDRLYMVMEFGGYNSKHTIGNGFDTAEMFWVHEDNLKFIDFKKPIPLHKQGKRIVTRVQAHAWTFLAFAVGVASAVGGHLL